MATRHPRAAKSLVWFAAFVCTILAVTVIIAGVVVLSVYFAYRPKIPFLRVGDAHLDRLGYDQSGLLDLAMSLTVEAVNDNGRAHATFSGVELQLRFGRTPLAALLAEDFDVPKNSTQRLRYAVEMDEALKSGRVEFALAGKARTRWRVALISVKFWTHLDCTLPFLYPAGDSADDLLHCTSKSH
ncbi:unnamed protein product [Spirodela intermedia]|uniref:Uncharacterized protein n=1 Tax=Spirodela intermedia TaxID=51605 RepID=A0A7I8JAG9_SPIIN|nr:unnamed protein product [Spirodela intermedia]CAA6667100.1 unnamed protein product [Spirodela intermedia]